MCRPVTHSYYLPIGTVWHVEVQYFRRLLPKSAWFQNEILLFDCNFFTSIIIFQTEIKKPTRCRDRIVQKK